MLKLNNFFLIMFMFMTIYMSMISSSMMFIWVMMEMNLLMFMPMLIMEKSYSYNSLYMYFIIQAVSGSMFFVSMINIYFIEIYYNYVSLFKLIMFMSIWIKLGVWPFYLWFIKMLNSVSWMIFFLLITIQKIIPFMVLSIYNMNMFSMMLIFVSSLVGCICVINEFSLKIILGYSSMNHMSWMIMAVMLNHNLFLLYFFMYFIISFILIMVLYKYDINWIIDLKYLYNLNSMNLFIFMNIFIMYMCIPPMMTFILKFFILSSLMDIYMIMFMLLMMLVSLISMYFYLRLMFMGLMFSLPKMKFNLYYYNNVNFMKEMNLFMFISMFFMIYMLFFFY
uniref:NADH-ubiquinone oxidoreductase chain 2 n=1 Tax=Ettchellsia sinica TaxID=1738633 RepID=A0A2S0B4E5_9HYME|nr:NADH dehydrogenase subunit 2 [Ettchellsia sinica]